jgi:tocopherol O-methyltransferase
MSGDSLTSVPALDPSVVAAHYDDLDLYYRTLWGEHVHHGLFEQRGMTPEQATRRLISVVADQAEIGEGSDVCDVGCGYGGTARTLAREKGARVTALTVSEAQHAYARNTDPGADNPRYLLCNWLENDLADSTFDVVLSIESSEHMPDLGAFFDEAARVLRPGGRMVVCAWLTRDRLRHWERRHLIGPICKEGRLRGMETRATYQNLATVAGLQPVGFQDVSRQVKATWLICASRAVAAFVRDPEARRFLLRDGGPNRIFALTVFRIWLSYEVGAMRYGILTFEKR